jgi:hypothetical protein
MTPLADLHADPIFAASTAKSKYSLNVASGTAPFRCRLRTGVNSPAPWAL